MIRKSFAILLFAALVACVAFLAAQAPRSEAADVEQSWYDGSKIRIHTGTTDIDISAAVYTSATVILTLEPPANTAAHDVSVTFDLDKTTTGFNDTHSSETIQFLVGRRVDGTNWRVDAQAATTAISGTNSNTRSVTLSIGTIGSNEKARVYVLLSAEAADCEFPYVVSYRSPHRMTFTDVAN